MTQPLRAFLLVVAVVASGLAFVVAAPAPPAAAAESFLLTQGPTTVRSSGEFSMCQQTVPDPTPRFRYLRRFHLADHGVPAGPFVLDDLSFGVAKVFKEGFADVRVYTIAANDPTMTMADLTPVASFRPTVDFSDQNSVLTFPVNIRITDASTQDLVLSVGGGSTGTDAFFAIGGSSSPEIKPGYIVAPYCGFADVTNTDVVAIRSDPVIFGSGSTVDPPTPWEPPISPQDLDGDGFLNGDDSCPNAYAAELENSSDSAPGCYEVFVTASANYDSGVIGGYVDWQLYDATPWMSSSLLEDVCNMPTEVTVWQLEDTDNDPNTELVRTTQLGRTFSGADGTFSLPVGELPPKTHYSAVTTPYGPVDGKAFCESRDGHWAGPEVRTVAVPVERTVEAEFRPGRVTGHVSISNPPAGTPNACKSGMTFQGFSDDPPFVELHQGTPDGDVAVDSRFAEADGSFTFALDPATPAGTRFFVRTAYMDDEPDGAWCLPADSAVVTAFDDGDEDGVPDPIDRCLGPQGPEGGAYPGCPMLPQVVTARIDGDTLSGTVTATGAVDGACSETVVHVDGPGDPIPVTGLTRAGEVREFSVSVADVPEGSRLQVRADGGFDEGKAHCLIGASGLVTAGDRDGDGVLNSLDVCPDVQGPANRFPSGCPHVQQQVTAAYDGGAITGVVTAQRPAGVPATACAGPPTVGVWRISGGDRVLVDAVDASGDGTYAVQVGEVADGTTFQARVFGYPDPDLALCLMGDSEVVEVHVDSDGDGVRDGVDECDHLDGAGAFARGCPDLIRQVSASYAAGAVSGRVSFVDGDVSTSACAQPKHTRILVYELGSDGAMEDLLGEGYYSPTDGRYSLDLDLPIGTDYQVFVLGGTDPDSGYCVPADSGKHTVADPDHDDDGDGVVNADDECTSAQGPGTSDGCPAVERVFTDVEYADGVVSGTLTVKDSTVGGCGAANQVWVTPGGGGDQVSGEAAETTGGFEIPVGMADKEVYVLKADSYRDSAVGWCGDGTTEAIAVVDTDGDDVRDSEDACDDVHGPRDEVPDVSGCPTLVRSVTAVYAGGAITGQVSVLGPNQSPAATCLLTQVRAFNVRDGVSVQVGPTTETAADGSYLITLGGGLAAASTYFVTIDRYLHGDDAVCAAAESARHQVPAVVIDPPGGGVPGVAPVLSRMKLTRNIIHVVGSRFRPRATTVKLWLNVSASVVVTLRGRTTVTSEPTGKKVVASLSKTLAAGASSIKLTGEIGTRRLPPGAYRVVVRAANVVGADTTAAGKLTIKP